MKRTHSIAIAAGLLSSAAFADIAADGSMAGSAFLVAGPGTQDNAFGVPTSETFILQAPPEGVGSASTTAKVVTQIGANSLTFDFDVVTSGVGPNYSGADVYIEFTLVESAFFTLEGSLAGLTFFQSSIQGMDNDFQLFDDVLFDQGEYTGTLVDGGTPASVFSRSGVLDAGTYLFGLSSFSEAIFDESGFDGVGGLSLSLVAVPAPGAGLALVGAGLTLAGRRRR